jgi:hypothetical protein
MNTESGLLCPTCGTQATTGIVGHESGKHRDCIRVGILKGVYADLNAWILASKINYELLISFFK